MRKSKTESNSFRKSIAILLLISFTLLNTVLNPYPLSAEPLHGAILHHGINQADPRSVVDSLSLPEGLGTIREKYVPEKGTGIKDKNMPVPFSIIYLESAHANLDSETNVRAIINYLEKNYGLSLVLLEGGEGRLDSLFFKSFPDRERKEKLLNEYLSRGDLSGGEVQSILDESSDIPYYGVETQDLYNQNKAAFLNAISQEEKIEKVLNSLKNELNEKAKTVINQDFLSFRESFLSFHDETIDLLSYMKTLKALYSKEDFSSSFSGLHTLLEAEENQKKMTPEAHDALVTQVLNAFKERVLPRLSKEDSMKINSVFQDYQTQRLDQGMLLNHIAEYADKAGLGFKIPEGLKEKAAESRKLSQIRGTRLFDELEQLENTLSELLPKTLEEKNLLLKDREFLMLKDFSRLELLPKDWENIREKGTGNNSLPSATTASPPAPFSAELFKPHFEFYELAEKRDEILFQNSLKLIGKEKAKVALLSTGGFHTKGVTDQLKASQIPYVLISPKINQLTDKSVYLAAMRDERSFMKDKTAVSLWDALAKDYASKLASSLKEEELTPSLKRWRDRIIQNSIAEGRITQATQYTKYVDALIQALRKEYQQEKGTGSELLPVSFSSEDQLKQALSRELDTFLNTYFSRLEQIVNQKLDIFSAGLKDLWKAGDVTPKSVGDLINRANQVAPKANLAAALALINDMTIADRKNIIRTALRKIPRSQRKNTAQLARRFKDLIENNPGLLQQVKAIGKVIEPDAVEVADLLRQIRASDPDLADQLETTAVLRRSEARPKLGNQGNVSEGVRFEDVRKTHVEFEWKASAEAKPITIDYILDQRIVYQLALLGINPNDFIAEIMQEIETNEALAELKSKMWFLGRSTFDIDPISVFASYDEDMPLANFLSKNVAKEILKRQVFDTITIKKRRDRLGEMFGSGEDTTPAAKIDAIAYYRGRFTDEDLYESLKGSLLNGLIVYNEIGALMQNRGLNDKTFEAFKTFVKENERNFTVRAKKLAYQLIYYQNMQNDVEDKGLEAKIAELETLDDQISDLNMQWTGLFGEREKIIQILKEIVQLDPNDRSIKSTLAEFEKSAQRERDQIAARKAAEDAVGKMTSYTNVQLFEEVYKAIASNNPILGTALLKLLSTRELSLSEINQILAFLPNLAENYQEASALFSQFSAKYRQSASETVVNGFGLDQEVQEIVQNIYIQYFEDSVQRRKALLSVAAESRIDSELIDQMESRLRNIIGQQISQIEESNRKVNLQSKKVKRFGFNTDLQSAVDALEAKYGITIEIPFEDDVSSIFDRPTIVGLGGFADLYSKRDIPHILEKLKELDQWLAVLPRDVVLKSLSFQRLEIMKYTRAHFQPSDRVEDNKIALGMESESPRRTLYHEVGHSLHGPSGEFAAYIDPARLTDLILKHRELFAVNDQELVNLTERKEIGVTNRSQVTWRVFQAIFNERKKEWLKMNKDLGVVDLNAPFKPQRTPEAIAQTFEHEGVSSDKQADKPSLTIEYIFEEPFFDNKNGQLTRKEPIELIAEYTQLYVLFPESLKRYDEVAFDFLEPILGSVHSRSEARAEEEEAINPYRSPAILPELPQPAKTKQTPGNQYDKLSDRLRALHRDLHAIQSGEMRVEDDQLDHAISSRLEELFPSIEQAHQFNAKMIPNYTYADTRKLAGDLLHIIQQRDMQLYEKLFAARGLDFKKSLTKALLEREMRRFERMSRSEARQTSGSEHPAMKVAREIFYRYVNNKAESRDLIGQGTFKRVFQTPNPNYVIKIGREDVDPYKVISAITSEKKQLDILTQLSKENLGLKATKIGAINYKADDGRVISLPVYVQAKFDQSAFDSFKSLSGAELEEALDRLAAHEMEVWREGIFDADFFPTDVGVSNGHFVKIDADFASSLPADNQHEEVVSYLSNNRSIRPERVSAGYHFLFNIFLRNQEYLSRDAQFDIKRANDIAFGIARRFFFHLNEGKFNEIRRVFQSAIRRARKARGQTEGSRIDRFQIAVAAFKERLNDDLGVQELVMELANQIVHVRSEKPTRETLIKQIQSARSEARASSARQSVPMRTKKTRLAQEPEILRIDIPMEVKKLVKQWIERSGQENIDSKLALLDEDVFETPLDRLGFGDFSRANFQVEIGNYFGVYQQMRTTSFLRWKTVGDIVDSVIEATKNRPVRSEAREWYDTHVEETIDTSQVRAGLQKISETLEQIKNDLRDDIDDIDEWIVPEDFDEAVIQGYVEAVDEFNRVILNGPMNAETLEEQFLKWHETVGKGFIHRPGQYIHDANHEELDKIFQYIFSPEFSRKAGEDPIKAAAAIFVRLVNQQAFSDGNKRASSLILNYILMKLGFTPFILTEENAAEYMRIVFPIREENEIEEEKFAEFLTGHVSRAEARDSEAGKPLPVTLPEETIEAYRGEVLINWNRKGREATVKLGKAYDGLVAALVDELKDRGEITFVYPFSGPDILFLERNRSLMLNDTFDDYEAGTQLIANIRGEKPEAIVERAKDNFIPPYLADASLPESYQKLKNRDPKAFPGKAALIMKGFQYGMKSKQETAREIIGMLQPGDYLVFLTQEDLQFAVENGWLTSEEASRYELFGDTVDTKTLFLTTETGKVMRLPDAFALFEVPEEGLSFTVRSEAREENFVSQWSMAIDRFQTQFVAFQDNLRKNGRTFQNITQARQLLSSLNGLKDLADRNQQPAFFNGLSPLVKRIERWLEGGDETIIESDSTHRSEARSVPEVSEALKLRPGYSGSVYQIPEAGTDRTGQEGKATLRIFEIFNLVLTPSEEAEVIRQIQRNPDKHILLLKRDIIEKAKPGKVDIVLTEDMGVIPAGVVGKKVTIGDNAPAILEDAVSSNLDDITSVAQVRLSPAGLFRVKVGDYYLLSLNKNRLKKSKFVATPIGGAYDFTSGQGKALYEQHGIVMTPDDEKKPLEMRQTINGNQVPVFLGLFNEGQGREISALRELQEELVGEGSEEDVFRSLPEIDRWMKFLENPIIPEVLKNQITPLLNRERQNIESKRSEARASAVVPEEKREDFFKATGAWLTYFETVISLKKMEEVYERASGDAIQFRGDLTELPILLGVSLSRQIRPATAGLSIMQLADVGLRTLNQMLDGFHQQMPGMSFQIQGPEPVDFANLTQNEMIMAGVLAGIAFGRARQIRELKEAVEYAYHFVEVVKKNPSIVHTETIITFEDLYSRDADTRSEARQQLSEVEYRVLVNGADAINQLRRNFRRNVEGLMNIKPDRDYLNSLEEMIQLMIGRAPLRRDALGRFASVKVKVPKAGELQPVSVASFFGVDVSYQRENGTVVRTLNKEKAEKILHNIEREISRRINIVNGQKPEAFREVLEASRQAVEKLAKPAEQEKAVRYLLDIQPRADERGNFQFRFEAALQFLVPNVPLDSEESADLAVVRREPTRLFQIAESFGKFFGIKPAPQFRSTLSFLGVPVTILHPDGRVEFVLNERNAATLVDNLREYIDQRSKPRSEARHYGNEHLNAFMRLIDDLVDAFGREHPAAEELVFILDMADDSDTTEVSLIQIINRSNLPGVKSQLEEATNPDSNFPELSTKVDALYSLYSELSVPRSEARGQKTAPKEGIEDINEILALDSPPPKSSAQARALQDIIGKDRYDIEASEWWRTQKDLNGRTYPVSFGFWLAIRRAINVSEDVIVRRFMRKDHLKDLKRHQSDWNIRTMSPYFEGEGGPRTFIEYLTSKNLINNVNPLALGYIQSARRSEVRMADDLQEITQIFGDKNSIGANLTREIFQALSAKWDPAERKLLIRKMLGAALILKRFEDIRDRNAEIMKKFETDNPGKQSGSLLSELAQATHTAWLEGEKQKQGFVLYTPELHAFMSELVRQGVMRDDKGSAITLAEFENPKKKFKFKGYNFNWSAMEDQEEMKQAMQKLEELTHLPGDAHTGRLVNTVAGEWDVLNQLEDHAKSESWRKERPNFLYGLQADSVAVVLGVLQKPTIISILKDGESGRENTTQALVNILRRINAGWRINNPWGGLDDRLISKPFDLEENDGIGLDDILKDAIVLKTVLEVLHRRLGEAKMNPRVKRSIKTAFNNGLQNVLNDLVDPDKLADAVRKNRVESVELTEEKVMNDIETIIKGLPKTARLLVTARSEARDEINDEEAGRIKAMLRDLPRVTRVRLKAGDFIALGDDTIVKVVSIDPIEKMAVRAGLIVREGEKQTKVSFDIRHGGETLIGRGASDIKVDLEIEDKSVSRRHARLINTGGTLFVEDMNSTNGTRVTALLDLAPLQGKIDAVIQTLMAKYRVPIIRQLIDDEMLLLKTSDPTISIEPGLWKSLSDVFAAHELPRDLSVYRAILDALPKTDPGGSEEFQEQRESFELRLSQLYGEVVGKGLKSPRHEAQYHGLAVELPELQRFAEGEGLLMGETFKDYQQRLDAIKEKGSFRSEARAQISELKGRLDSAKKIETTLAKIAGLLAVKDGETLTDVDVNDELAKLEPPITTDTGIADMVSKARGLINETLTDLSALQESLANALLITQSQLKSEEAKSPLSVKTVLQLKQRVKRLEKSVDEVDELLKRASTLHAEIDAHAKYLHDRKGIVIPARSEARAEDVVANVYRILREAGNVTLIEDLPLMNEKRYAVGVLIVTDNGTTITFSDREVRIDDPELYNAVANFLKVEARAGHAKPETDKAASDLLQAIGEYEYEASDKTSLDDLLRVLSAPNENPDIKREDRDRLLTQKDQVHLRTLRMRLAYLIEAAPAGKLKKLYQDRLASLPEPSVEKQKKTVPAKLTKELIGRHVSENSGIEINPQSNGGFSISTKGRNNKALKQLEQILRREYGDDYQFALVEGSPQIADSVSRLDITPIRLRLVRRSEARSGARPPLIAEQTREETLDEVTLDEETLDQDLYAYLGLEESKKGATIEDIKGAFRKRALATHPDKEGGAREEFFKVELAHQILTDSASKKYYDINSPHGNSYNPLNATLNRLRMNMNNFGNSPKAREIQAYLVAEGLTNQFLAEVIQGPNIRFSDRYVMTSQVEKHPGYDLLGGTFKVKLLTGEEASFSSPRVENNSGTMSIILFRQDRGSEEKITIPVYKSNKMYVFQYDFANKRDVLKDVPSKAFAEALMNRLKAEHGLVRSNNPQRIVNALRAGGLTYEVLKKAGLNPDNAVYHPSTRKTGFRSPEDLEYSQFKSSFNAGDISFSAPRVEYDFFRDLELYLKRQDPAIKGDGKIMIRFTQDGRIEIEQFFKGADRDILADVDAEAFADALMTALGLGHISAGVEFTVDEAIFLKNIIVPEIQNIMQLEGYDLVDQVTDFVFERVRLEMGFDLYFKVRDIYSQILADNKIDVNDLLSGQIKDDQYRKVLGDFYRKLENRSEARSNYGELQVQTARYGSSLLKPNQDPTEGLIGLLRLRNDGISLVPEIRVLFLRYLTLMREQERGHFDELMGLFNEEQKRAVTEFMNLSIEKVQKKLDRKLSTRLKALSFIFVVFARNLEKKERGVEELYLHYWKENPHAAGLFANMTEQLSLETVDDFSKVRSGELDRFKFSEASFMGRHLRGLLAQYGVSVRSEAREIDDLELLKKLELVDDLESPEVDYGQLLNDPEFDFSGAGPLLIQAEQRLNRVEEELSKGDEHLPRKERRDVLAVLLNETGVFLGVSILNGKGLSMETLLQLLRGAHPLQQPDEDGKIWIPENIRLDDLSNPQYLSYLRARQTPAAVRGETLERIQSLMERLEILAERLMEISRYARLAELVTANFLRWMGTGEESNFGEITKWAKRIYEHPDVKGDATKAAIRIRTELAKALDRAIKDRRAEFNLPQKRAGVLSRLLSFFSSKSSSEISDADIWGAFVDATEIEPAVLMQSDPAFLAWAKDVRDVIRVGIYVDAEGAAPTYTDEALANVTEMVREYRGLDEDKTIMMDIPLERFEEMESGEVKQWLKELAQGTADLVMLNKHLGIFLKVPTEAYARELRTLVQRLINQKDGILANQIRVGTKVPAGMTISVSVSPQARSELRATTLDSEWLGDGSPVPNEENKEVRLLQAGAMTLTKSGESLLKRVRDNFFRVLNREVFSRLGLLSLKLGQEAAALRAMARAA